jgi:hypothetical protein
MYTRDVLIAILEQEAGSISALPLQMRMTATLYTDLAFRCWVLYYVSGVRASMPLALRRHC